jgi:hypothetical protein
MIELTPQTTFAVLLAVQALHLLYHRLVKRHISYAEVIGAAVLCVPLATAPAWAIMTAHLGMCAVQIAGSLWIKRLSPSWRETSA